VLEHVDGETLRQAVARLRDRERFFARLLETIQAMHTAGVAHGDLKRKENTLVTADESPRIIDFGIAAISGASGLHRRQFDTMCQMDLNAWVKLKHGRNVGSLPAAEAGLYRPLLVERWARKARKPWKLLTLRSLRKRRRAERGRR
jgi:serine/threonine protein kinase